MKNIQTKDRGRGKIHGEKVLMISDITKSLASMRIILLARGSGKRRSKTLMMFTYPVTAETSRFEYCFIL